MATTIPDDDADELNTICANINFTSPPIIPVGISQIVYTILMPFVCVLGAVGASISIFIFTRKQMSSSLNTYLAALSIFDLVLLLTALLIYPSMQVCLQDGNEGRACYFFWRSSLASYPISLMAQTASVWTCVAITFDRYLAVKYPLHTRAWCTTHRARAVVFCIAVVAILYKMPSIFELSLDECGRLKPTALRKDPLYGIIYNTYGYLLLLIIIPLGVIIVLNCIVVTAVREANRRRRAMRMQQQRASKYYSASMTIIGCITELESNATNVIATTTNSSSRVGSRRGRCSSSTTIPTPASANSNNLDDAMRCTTMATLTILSFVIFNCLAGMNNIIEAFDLRVPGNDRIPIGNLLVCLNSATNILIYSLFGQRFRTLCASILCPCLRMKTYYDPLARST